MSTRISKFSLFVLENKGVVTADDLTDDKGEFDSDLLKKFFPSITDPKKVAAILNKGTYGDVDGFYHSFYSYAPSDVIQQLMRISGYESYWSGPKNGRELKWREIS